MARSELRLTVLDGLIPNGSLLLYPCSFYFAPSGAAKRRQGQLYAEYA